MKLKIGGICIAVAERLRKITVDSDRRKQRIMHAKDRIERILDAGESIRILIERCRARFPVVAGCIMTKAGFYTNKRQRIRIPTQLSIGPKAIRMAIAALISVRERAGSARSQEIFRRRNRI